MLKAIRNFKLGWIVVVLGIVGIVSGISMTDAKSGQKTLVCFDQGCIYVQGVSNVIVGILCLVLGIYLLFKR